MFGLLMWWQRQFSKTGLSAANFGMDKFSMKPNKAKVKQIFVQKEENSQI